MVVCFSVDFWLKWGFRDFRDFSGFWGFGILGRGKKLQKKNKKTKKNKKSIFSFLKRNLIKPKILRSEIFPY
jgi:hypothetical protein